MMTATQILGALPTEPLSEFKVECAIEAHDGIHRLCLVVLATDEDDAADQALHMLDHGRVTEVCSPPAEPD